MNNDVRNNVEQIIKIFSLDRHRVFEVSKQKYEEVLKKIEHTFVIHNRTIHWANMGNFKPELRCRNIDCRDNILWFEKLDEIIPYSEMVYVLLEECRPRPKYWLYEMYLEELKVILGEMAFLEDYYIVSKKYEWLISENHHGVVSFVGNGFDFGKIEIEGE